MKTVVDLVRSLKSYFLGKDILIESSIAPVESDPSDSSRAYSIGDQLYVNNVLYEATASIAIHDALVEGTNIQTADSISEQLKNIPDMIGATSSANGVHGLVPQPLIADKDKFLKGDGTWGDASSSISTLTDVNLTTLANKDVLRYNSTSQKWENDQLNDKADKTDLTSIIATGATNTTGAPITKGTYFYKDGIECRAIADIATNATFTLNTNYVTVSQGGLNDVKSEAVNEAIAQIKSYTYSLTAKAISAGAIGTWTINAPAGATRIIAITINVISPTTWGNAVPMVLSGLSISGTSAELTVRAYASDTFTPKITMVYI